MPNFDFEISGTIEASDEETARDMLLALPGVDHVEDLIEQIEDNEEDDEGDDDET